MPGITIKKSLISLFLIKKWVDTVLIYVVHKVGIILRRYVVLDCHHAECCDVVDK